jgi:hypothetical protein
MHTHTYTHTHTHPHTHTHIADALCVLQVPDELGDCFEQRGIISHVATVLLWYLIFVLPLLSLNALIAIMGTIFSKSTLCSGVYTVNILGH